MTDWLSIWYIIGCVGLNPASDRVITLGS